MTKFIAGILISITTITLSGCSEEEPKAKEEIAKPVKTMTIGTASDVESREFPGKVRAAKDVTLSFQVPGQLVEFPVIKGQDIAKGDLIAKLDPTDYQLKVQEAQATFTERQLALERAKGLLPDGFISQSDYDKIKSQYDVAESNLAQAKQDLKYTEIYAPYTGRIADTYPDNFQYIVSKQPIVLLQDTTELDIIIDVPESLLIRIEDTTMLSKVAVFESAPDKSYPVEYRKHVEDADPATQTYRVYMGLKSPEDLTVLPGMTATVKTEFTQVGDLSRQNAFLIPSSAVFADEHGKQFVWMVDQKTSRVKAHEVIAGELSGDMILITTGLKTGDQIVTAGVHSLIQNQLVKPLPPAPE